MFRKLLDEFYVPNVKVLTPMGIFTAFSTLWGFATAIIVAIVKILTDFQPGAFELFLVMYPISTTLLVYVLYMLFNVANCWLYFATNDKFELYTYVFGDLFEEIKEKYGVIQTGFGEKKFSYKYLKESLSATIIALVLSIMQLCFIIFVLLWYVPYFTIISGVLVGGTFLSRSMFRVSDKFVEHTKDPDAHKPKNPPKSQ